MSTTYLLVAGDARIASLVATAPGPVTAVVVGGRETAVQVAATPGVASVVWLGEPGVAPLEAFAPAVADLVEAARPGLVLAATRPAERVLAGAVAARLAAPVMTLVQQVVVSDDGAEVTRGVHGGIARETVTVAGPVVVLGDGGALAEGGSAVVEEAAVTPAPTLEVRSTQAAAQAQVDLTRAPRIVAAGRGVKNADDLALVTGLAAAIGAEVACSRPLAEGVGWFAKDRYVGVTGQHVSPDLYVAVGISGQLQHTVGARSAGTVVAVNSDPSCPYFAEADYCVVGDLYQVLPALTEALS